MLTTVKKLIKRLFLMIVLVVVLIIGTSFLIKGFIFSRDITTHKDIQEKYKIQSVYATQVDLFFQLEHAGVTGEHISLVPEGSYYPAGVSAGLYNAPKTIEEYEHDPVKAEADINKIKEGLDIPKSKILGVVKKSTPFQVSEVRRYYTLDLLFGFQMQDVVSAKILEGPFKEKIFVLDEIELTEDKFVGLKQ